MEFKIGQVKFSSQDQVDFDIPELSNNRLQQAHSKLSNHVPGQENALRIFTMLKRVGLDIQELKLTKLTTASKKNKTTRTPKPSTPVTPKDQKPLEGGTQRKTRFSRGEILSCFMNGIKPQLRREIEQPLEKAQSAEKALSELEKLEKKHDTRKTLPHSIMDMTQKGILNRHPDSQVSTSWFSDRMKRYDDFKRMDAYKEEGSYLYPAVREYLKSNDWSNVHKKRRL
ncbi:hypothetical protein BDA99DRAFT_562319 [Phascolomyces articulosus]|uniref:Uncharacterized protein n=1 Tax=Phascolomyces articulosus TaxID=60185 RepID=A0AAD5K568_9FUNG|nr:hypothetical protein BDA99DRAFT_562319 [Phascolomyces articulosus]